MLRVGVDARRAGEQRAVAVLAAGLGRVCVPAY